MGWCHPERSEGSALALSEIIMAWQTSRFLGPTKSVGPRNDVIGRENAGYIKYENALIQS